MQQSVDSYRSTAGSVTVGRAENFPIAMKAALNPLRTMEMTSKHAVRVTATNGGPASTTDVAVL